MRLHIIQAALLASALLMLQRLPAAHAEDAPHRASLEARSRAAGLGVRSVELLQRLPGPGARATLDRLRARWTSAAGAITTRGPATEERGGGEARLEGDGWSLIAYGDGTQVRYRNRALRAAPGRALAPGERPSLATLEELGRRFLAEHLAGELRLGAGERLELQRVAYEQQGLHSVDGRPATSRIISAAVAFTRTIDGVDLVGPGSKVTVFLHVDGTPWGFDYDWPVYRRAGSRQELLDLPAIRARARALDELPADRLTSVREDRWECGYFDPGARKRDASALVQAACVAHKHATRVTDEARHRGNPADGVITLARMEVIPAAVRVEPDARWPQARRVRGEPPLPPAAQLSPAP